MLEDIDLNNTWLDIYDVASIAVGTKLLLQNKSGYFIHVWTGATAPTKDTSGLILDERETYEVVVGSDSCFVKGIGKLFVQDLT